MEKKVLVKSIIKNSIAQEVGIEAGDEIKSINKSLVIDIFDYKYLISDTYLEIEVIKKNGEIWDIEIEKDLEEEMGIEFYNDLINGEKSCKNKCIFCFIDQMPKNMRKTLYFKDDDSRLSFLTGNYVTLTNVNDDEMKRIVKYRLSPINISVHTTNLDLRTKMLKNDNARNILDKIEYFDNNNIKLNCQIVLCKNINDGQELIKTIYDLEKYKNIESVSIVPVGLTKFRDKLADLKSFNSNDAKEIVNMIGPIQEFFLSKRESRFVYLADEFYINAKVIFPEYETYEDFPQIENGVGLFPKFKYDFLNYLDKLKSLKLSKEIEITLVTGVLIYKEFKKLLDKIEKKVSGLKLDLRKIENEFFGKDVNVTGLITGSDIIKQLKGSIKSRIIVICRSMLKADEDIFLDDITLDDLEKELKVKVITVNNDAKELINVIINIIHNQ